MSELKKLDYKHIQIIGTAFFVLILDTIVMKYSVHHIQTNMYSVFGVTFFLVQMALINFSLAFIVLVWRKNKRVSTLLALNAFVCLILFFAFWNFELF